MDLSATTDPKRIVFCGAVEICNAVGVNYKEIVYYVDKLGLPAFKIKSPEGRVTKWLALPEDLERWAREQRDKNLSA